MSDVETKDLEYYKAWVKDLLSVTRSLEAKFKAADMAELGVYRLAEIIVDTQRENGRLAQRLGKERARNRMFCQMRATWESDLKRLIARVQELEGEVADLACAANSH